MRRLAHQTELLDGQLDPHDLLGTLRDLSRVNRWLGGVALSRSALIALATGIHAWRRTRGIPWRQRPLELLDVGTGGGDIPVALLRWTARRGLLLTVEGTDSREEMIEAARALVGGTAGLHLALSDGRALEYPDGSFDVAHASLMLHHLEPDEVVAVLLEMARVSRTGVIVNDLERGRISWFFAWLMAHLFTRNRYTQHDGPLSVRRAYRPAEIAQLATRAGLVEVARYRGYLRHRYALAFVRASAPPHGANQPVMDASSPHPDRAAASATPA